MRFLLRLASLVLLAAAVIVGVIDSIQSVAGEMLFLTPFGAALDAISPVILAASEAFVVAKLSPGAWDLVGRFVLLQPAVMIFLVASLALYILAYKRVPAAGRFAA